MRRPLILLPGLVLSLACATGGAPSTAPPTAPAPRVMEAVHTFADIPVQELRAHPDRYAGAVFDEQFIFARVWWGRDRARPGIQSLDLPTHFTARISAAPLYIARIEFPPEADALFERRRGGTTLRLRVRFRRLYTANRAPIFTFEEVLPAQRPGSDLEYLQR